MAQRIHQFTRAFAYFAAIATGILSLHCSSEEERPPPYTRAPIDAPRSCGELFTNGVLVGQEIMIDGKRAGCAARNLECALEGSPEFSGRCDGGKSGAICGGNVWHFQCSAPADAGTDT